MGSLSDGLVVPVWPYWLVTAACPPGLATRQVSWSCHPGALLCWSREPADPLPRPGRSGGQLGERSAVFDGLVTQQRAALVERLVAQRARVTLLGRDARPTEQRETYALRNPSLRRRSQPALKHNKRRWCQLATSHHHHRSPANHTHARRTHALNQCTPRNTRTT